MRALRQIMTSVQVVGQASRLPPRASRPRTTERGLSSPTPLTSEVPVQSSVPQGQSKIAQPFKAGCRVAVVLSSGSDDGTCRFSVVPDGTSGTKANPGPSLERLGYFQPSLRDEGANV